MAISVSFANVSARIPLFHENNIHTYLDVAANVLGKMFGGNDWLDGAVWWGKKHNSSPKYHYNH